MKMFYLAKILRERTDDVDDKHGLTEPELEEALLEYDVEAGRKSIYDDINALNEYALQTNAEFEIMSRRVGPRTLYYWSGREFEMPELKLLADAIQASKFISKKKTEELIRKLERQVSRYEAGQLKRDVYLFGRAKSKDESIYYAIDAIHNAISANRKVRYKYFSWGVSGKPEYRHNGAYYEVSPWGLIWDDENYYMIGYDSDVEDIRYYRVDKMRNVEVMEDTAREGAAVFKKIDKSRYANKRFRMYDGEEQTVKLICKNWTSNVIVDQFGNEVSMRRYDDEHFTVNVDVAVSNQFYGWLVGIGGDIQILEPVNLREEMQNQLKKFLGSI